jgi:outer membrane receptor protein involved in Fe transport
MTRFHTDKKAKHMNSSKKFLLSSVTLAVLTLISQAQAADSPVPAPAPQAESPVPAQAQAAPAKDSVAAELQQVVVTGVAASRGVRKLDSAFSITTASEEQLKSASPSSTADVLKLVPGVYAEATGGQSGANIEVRGFPSGSDSPFVSIQMQGNPIYPVPTLSFFEGSSAFRLDDTIERVEVLRGGPSTIFSSGQPGATVNFILKKGTDTPEGTVRFTAGTGELRRLDMFYGGKISDGWYGTIGGFYRTSHGVRDSGFPADDGHQITATLTRKLDDGELTIYARNTNDKNAFYTGVPLISSNEGRSISAFPGFDPLKGTLMSGEMRRFTIEAAPGKTLTYDLGDGRGLKGTVFGADFDQNFNGWSISNKFNRFDADMNTIAMFTGNNPLSMGAYNAAAIASANGSAATLAAAGGTPATGAAATFVNGGGAVSDSTQVVQAGLWAVEKKLKSFTDELRVSREWLPNNTVTVGGYFASYSSDDVWYLGNSHLMTAVPNASLINVKLNNGVVVSNNGTDGNVFYAPNASYDGTNTAFFISNEWKVSDRIKVDAGARRERQKIDGSVSNLISGDTDNNPLTVYNNGTSMPSGSYTALGRKDTANSFTIGGNYKLTKDASVFVRANTGHTFISFDDLRNTGTQAKVDDHNILPTPKATQYEIGFKTVGELYSAYVNAFHTEFEGIAFQQVLVDRILNSTSGSKGNGLEWELALRPIKNLTLTLTGDYQKSEYKDNPDTAGKTVQRQPKLQYRFTPTYKFPLGDNQSIKVYGTFTSIGERWADQANQQYLPSYRTYDLGVLYSIGEKIEIRLSGTNLNNTLGLTEGNSRLTTGGSGPINARPLFGRAAEASLLYRF